MFGTSGIRGAVGSDVTAELAVSVGRAVASGDARRVVVGRDVRESGELLKDAVAAGLRECGVDVIDVGVAATPTIARAVGRHGADAGVAVTASHNPPTDNGFKLWNADGMAYSESQREEISRRVRESEYELVAAAEVGSVETDATAVERHVDALCDAVEPLDLDVAVDVGNGSGLLTATALDRLGCSVTTLNAQPDGQFPGRPSEPTAETLADLCEFVAAAGADLGVAHDGDADRMMAVDGRGRFVDGDVLLALFGRTVAGEGDSVAVPIDTSLVVDDTVGAGGAAVRRTKVGDVYVAELATEIGAAFGGEPSGAWIWPEETLCPDGPLAACKLAELVGRRGPLAELVDGIDSYPIERASVETDEKAAVMDRLAEAVAAEYDEVETVDGVRVQTEDGWFLVRASGTEPKVRVTAEARDAARARELFETARSFVEDARLTDR